jgi:hypothetical protein
VNHRAAKRSRATAHTVSAVWVRCGLQSADEVFKEFLDSFEGPHGNKVSESVSQ